jgi:hypothetical protein
MINFFKEKFILGYNDGLMGAKEFSILSDAISEGRDASSIMENITIRDKCGRLIIKFD